MERGSGMININTYVVNGKVDRTSIVHHVKNRVLTGDDLLEVIANPDVQAAFIGTNFSDKIDQSNWDKAYLDKLTLMAVGESFNKDYLVYLDKVAAFVMSKNKFETKKLVNIVMVLLVLIALCGVANVLLALM